MQSAVGSPAQPAPRSLGGNDVKNRKRTNPAAFSPAATQELEKHIPKVSTKPGTHKSCSTLAPNIYQIFVTFQTLSLNTVTRTRVAVVGRSNHPKHRSGHPRHLASSAPTPTGHTGKIVVHRTFEERTISRKVCPGRSWKDTLRRHFDHRTPVILLEVAFDGLAAERAALSVFGSGSSCESWVGQPTSRRKNE